MNKALRNCGYPDWAFTKGAAPLQPHDHTNREKGKTTCRVTLPYIRRLFEELHMIFRDHRCSTNFKPGDTIQQLLVSPNDPAKKEEAFGVVYRINCEGGQEYMVMPQLLCGRDWENA